MTENITYPHTQVVITEIWRSLETAHVKETDLVGDLVRRFNTSFSGKEELSQINTRIGKKKLFKT